MEDSRGSRLLRRTSGRKAMFVKLFFRKQKCRLGLFGNKVLRKNLQNTYCTQPIRNGYKYLLVLDFEATCDTERKICPEIIEFPCLKVNLSNLKEEARFHYYVRPVENPILTPFCITLTGILQEVVDEAKTFPEVYGLFEKWRQDEGLTGENSLYVTSGNWDLGHMIPKQCLKCNLDIPPHMNEWVDIKILFGQSHSKFVTSFTDVMVHYGLKFEGRAHSGIDDTLNMLRAIRKMVEEGVEFQPTCRLVNLKVEMINTTSADQKLMSKNKEKNI